MSDVRELYQELIIDHYKRPRNFGRLADADCTAEGYNPLCGDRVRVDVKTAGDRIEDMRFEGSGCAISTATASLMTEFLKGKTLAEANELFELFHRHLVGQPEVAATPRLGKLAVLLGVREFPARVKCATLAWHTLRAALARNATRVSTE